MDKEISTCPWEAIYDFHSREEFDRFEVWLKKQIASGEALEVTVTTPYIDAPSFTEKWFKHLCSGAVWRLVWPDGTFTGVFELVR